MTGGAATGGLSTGGAASAGSGGQATGGDAATGGAATGGAATTGGSSTGGAATGGSASGGTASGGDGSGGDGSGGGEASGCPAGALFCDDFESGNFDAWSKVIQNGGTMTVASTFTTSGSGALFIDTPAGQRGGFLELNGAPLFPLPDKIMYGRAMVLFEGGSPDGHTDVIRGADANGGVPYYNLGHQHHEILLNYYVSYPEEDCWARPMPGYDLPVDTWMCWEWKFDGNASEIEYYIDGNLERKVSQFGDGCLNGNHEWEAPEFGTLQVGEYIAEAGDPSKIWIDDVAVGTSGLLGCPTP